MNEERKDIKIPIKSIIEDALLKNGSKYDEDEFNLLRKYFIACLNLGFLTPNDLVLMVNKFVSKIKFIVLNYNNINKMDYYMINESVLYISGALKDNNFAFYQITFYKAVTEVIFICFTFRDKFAYTYSSVAYFLPQCKEKSQILT